MTRTDVLRALSNFKSARDNMLHADDDAFFHYLQIFVKQLETSPFSFRIIEGLPPFNVDEWWYEQTKSFQQYRRLEALDLPDSNDSQLSIYVDFARSFISKDQNSLSVESFGRFFGKYKKAEAISLARSLILHPLAEELSTRLRESIGMANPDVRELAGVPLNRIPSEKELGIFLSHKWANKELVRRYYKVLNGLGYKPWLDEESITAGDVLHRALDEGMDSSCAAVFFVTPEFKDEQWIGREVDLAINRKIARGSKFQIIALVLGKAEVPKAFRTYVCPRIENDLDGLHEIVRSLPIQLGPARWTLKAIADNAMS